jgi:L-lactate dehydrogenase complex protein LldE
MKVSLFIPCLTSQFDPRVAEATARLLLHLGVDLDHPTAQTCCGQPLETVGDLPGAASVAARMARVFDRHKPDWIVTPSASCAGRVRSCASSISGRTLELSDFLATILDFDPSRVLWPGRATYHPSCHSRLVAHTGRTDHTLALLSRIPNLELSPLPRAAQCCGFGGVFSAAFPDVSVALGDDKLAAATATAPTLIVNDGGCRLHLRGFNPPLELKHLAEILAEGLGLMPRKPLLRRAVEPRA